MQKNIIHCNLCGRKCNAKRTNETNIGGYCKMSLTPMIAHTMLHMWEEPCISGINGSGTVFFSGCSLRCVFCQNWEISHENYGKAISIERLADVFYELEHKGAHNINLVNPTHYVHSIVEALKIYKPNIPVVYNSGGYDDIDTIKMLKGYVDVYLMDFKYISTEKSEKYSKAANYPEVAQNCILECIKQIGETVIDSDGLMVKGVIIRHLVLPASTSEAMKIIDWVKTNAFNAYFSLMSQYTPHKNAYNFKELSRKVTSREYNKVLNYLIDSNIKNVYIQELSSSNKDYVPKFTLNGI